MHTLFSKAAMIGAVAIMILVSGCRPVTNTNAPMSNTFSPGTFGYDLAFLDKFQQMIVLESEDSLSQVAIAPGYQGRVMTSTSNGLSGISYGWINYKAIESDSIKPHINPYGGEDRIWLGPEGGQFSVYFAPGVPFTFENWQVPKAFDTEPFDLVSHNRGEASFEKKIELMNYSGTAFNLKINRTIRLLDRNTVVKCLLTNIPDSIEWVGYETENTLTNTGNFEWNKQTGMFSIWLLGMFVPSPAVTVFIPYRQGNNKELGKVVTDDYFGKVPSDRLKVEDGFVFLKCDGHYRSKIGISPFRAMPYAASYDAENHVLTIINFSLPSMHLPYVNSLWKIQDDPFSGDAVNSYNDGTLADGTQMGPFFEIESSSPAAALKPGASLTHFSRTMHFRGQEAQLNKLCRLVLGIDLNKVKSVFESQ